MDSSAGTLRDNNNKIPSHNLSRISTGYHSRQSHSLVVVVVFVIVIVVDVFVVDVFVVVIFVVFFVIVFVVIVFVVFVVVVLTLNYSLLKNIHPRKTILP